MYAENVYTKIFSIIALEHDLNDTQIGVCMFYFLNEKNISMLGELEKAFWSEGRQKFKLK